MPMVKKTCEWCRRDFWAQRHTAKFCSTRCRVASHRAEQNDISAPDLERLKGIHARYPDVLDPVQQILITYGRRACALALDAIEVVLKEES